MDDLSGILGTGVAGVGGVGGLLTFFWKLFSKKIDALKIDLEKQIALKADSDTCYEKHKNDRVIDTKIDALNQVITELIKAVARMEGKVEMLTQHIKFDK